MAMNNRQRDPRFGSLLLTCAVLAAFILSGCARALMPTPNLYADTKSNPFADVPPQFRNNLVDVLYATDRLPFEEKDGMPQYGFGRSPSLAFGSCVVEIGKDLSWETLVHSSRGHERPFPLKLSIREITEHARFPATPIPIVRGEKGFTDDPAVASRQAAVAKQLRQELQDRLSRTPRKEAFIFIHGIKNTFEKAAFVIAELWHFLGREGVPIMYTWPAGRSGLLKGYTYDRESGEFTIYHLKQFIRILASSPALEKIHVIAHSRGTDIAASALRELFIEAKAAGINPRKKFKIANLVLVAPDLDLDVVIQRFGAERFALGVERLTMYVSEWDSAIQLASVLFTSRRRLGQLRAEDFTPEMKKTLKRYRRIEIIDVRVENAGHSYFREDPSASSDLILLLRDNRAPGSAHGRPLIERIANYWELYEGYPAPPHKIEQSP
ncbi:MAG: alpha/beta hydrolase [Candidatus Methylomirabilales bacterium]